MTRNLTAQRAITESILKALEYLTTSSDERVPRTNVAAPRIAEVGEAPPAQSISAFNAGVRAAHRADEPVAAAGADVNGIAPPPSLNASIKALLKKGFSR